MRYGFEGNLDVRIPDADDLRTLLADFSFWSQHLNERVAVPSGFKTDYASVPRVLWSILPPTGRYTKAAVIHDWLYVAGRCSRADADAVFLEAMEHLGVSPLTRRLMWAGVRAGGWMPWRKRREAGA